MRSLRNYVRLRIGVIPCFLVCLIIFLVWFTLPSRIYPSQSTFDTYIRPALDPYIIQQHRLIVSESAWYGFSAYPKITDQTESWEWILKFVESVPHHQINIKDQNLEKRLLIANSIRFTGAKTVDGEKMYLNDQINLKKVSIRVTNVPFYDCFHEECIKENPKRIFRSKDVPPITDDIIVFHALCTDLFDLNRMIVLMKNPTQTLVTAITIFPSEAINKAMEENYALPLYNFFHRLYFDYHWIPATSTQINCSNHELRKKYGCQLWITWKAWSINQPLEYIPPAGSGSAEMELQRLSSFLNSPRTEVCEVQQRIGGKWYGNAIDGTYTVCLDDLVSSVATNSCLVYSFGVLDDWTFDDTMSGIGCEVHSFDPSLNVPSHQRGEARHWFHNWGLETNVSFVDPKWDVASYSKIRERLGHKTRFVTILKMDVEGAEWPFIRDAMYDSSFNFVDQFVFEIHGPISKADGWAHVIQQQSMMLHYLEKRGFFLYNVRLNANGYNLRSLDYLTKLSEDKSNFFYELSMIRKKMNANS